MNIWSYIAVGGISASIGVLLGIIVAAFLSAGKTSDDESSENDLRNPNRHR